MTTETAAIRDALFVLLQTLQGPQGYANVRKTPVRQLDETDCPALTLVIGDDNAQADDDATAGPPHFVHETGYHISVVRNFADPATLDGLIDADMDAIQQLILRDPGFNASIEGITSMRRSRAFPTTDKGAYLVELRFELTVQYRSMWQPVIPDDFTGADVRSLPAGSSPLVEPVFISIDVETAP